MKNFKYYAYVTDNGDRNILKRSRALKPIEDFIKKNKDLVIMVDTFKDTDELNKFGNCLFISKRKRV